MTILVTLLDLNPCVVQGAPQVHYYQFLPEQRSVRLVVESEDDVCSTIAVQNYTVSQIYRYEVLSSFKIYNLTKAYSSKPRSGCKLDHY